MIEIPDEHLARLTYDLTGWQGMARRVDPPPRTMLAEVEQAPQVLVEIRAYLNSVSGPSLKCDPEDYPLSMYGFVPTLAAINELRRQRDSYFNWAKKFRDRLDAFEGRSTPDSDWAAPPEEKEIPIL